MKLNISLCSFGDKSTRKEWNDLYKNNKMLMPFSSYDFNRLFIKYFHKTKKRRNIKVLIVRVSDEKDRVRMFIPLCKHHGYYYLLWDYSSVPYCDFIYAPDVTSDEIERAVIGLSEVLGNEAVLFTKMPDYSAVTKALLGSYTPYKSHTCGDIGLLRSYDMTYRLFDKECRENIDEARQKIEDAGFSYSTDFYYRSAPPKRICSDISFIKYGEKRGPIRSLKNKIKEKKSPVTRALKRGVNSLVAISYIDGYPVSYLSGFVRQGKMYLYQLASTKYGVSYSANHLLLCDTVKYLIEEKKYDSIDLYRLNDKVKADFTQKYHKFYNFEIKL